MTKSNLDIALLLIRVALGAVFVAHGWDKVMNMEGIISFFASKGIPTVVTYIVAYGEVIGGLSMILGVFTGWSGIFLAAVMIGAISMVKIGKGFVGGFEFELVLFLIALAISFSGPGRYTLVERWNKNNVE